MKYGLFVHLVYGHEYGDMNPLTSNGVFPKDINQFANSFDVNRFVDDVQSMGFEYVIFTAWHANMNVLYPSKVMEKWRGKEHTSHRDLLGELADALNKRGIHLCLYTHIWVGNDFHPKGEGYYYYANKKGIITEDQKCTGYPESVEGNSTKWNKFVTEIYDEMSSRYGQKISAYWFDGTWTNNVDKNAIMKTIQRTNKTCAFVANGTMDHGMPYCSKEVGSPDDIGYGFAGDFAKVNLKDVRTWPSYERNIALIQGGNWWASVGGKRKFDAETVFLFTVLEAATNKGGGVSWAFAPFVNGEWEDDMLAEMQKVNAYLKPVVSSVKNTKPSTSYITKEGSFIKKLPLGFVATQSPDGLYEYIHVLKSPNGNDLYLSNSLDGKIFKRAYLEKNGKELVLKKNNAGYVIVLGNDESWDKLDTVIRLEM